MANNEYIILQGIDYPPKKRAEAGQTVDDLPKEAIPWLLASGIIKPAVSSGAKVASKAKPIMIMKEVEDEL